MQILKIQVLRGPNIWSNYRKKLIQVRLDLGKWEQYPTDKIPGFRERIQDSLPTLISHECSEGTHAGFFERVRRGTWLGHVMEHIALELQTLAGMETGYGRTRGTDTKGVYNMVFTYTIEEAGIFAAHAALRLTLALAEGRVYDINPDIDELKRIARTKGLGPSTASIVAEAERRGIPWTKSGSGNLVRLGYGKNQSTIQATITSKTSLLGVEIAGDKDYTKKLLQKALIPVSKGSLCYTLEDLQQVIDEIGFPIVIKPLNANQGKGATINIENHTAAIQAFEHAKEFGRSVIVEKFVEGSDFRLLVINNTFVAASKRIPAHVTGNGTCTITQLIEYVNSDPKRGYGHESALTKITVDRDTEEMLAKYGLQPDSVPARDEIVYLKSTANLSTGGTAIDVTDEVCPENVFMAERISKVMGLDICGIDIMAIDLQSPLRTNGGAVIEVNAAPGFRMHLNPSQGKPRNVGAAVVNMLYPPGKPARIPLIAVTGTNGKTTTTRLLAHLARRRGYNVGYTTTDGIYINDFLIEEGDTTGPVSASFILGDPSVDFAVLETARGGILRSGLSFDQSDVAIITNIREDHLGLNDINSLDDLANVKAVVARSVKKDGWAVLNADDPQCMKIAADLDCQTAFFTLDPASGIIQSQAALRRPVAWYDGTHLIIHTGIEKIIIENVTHIPLTFNGTAHFMIANALAASLAGHLSGFSADEIRKSLQTFSPGIEQTPGRLNMFKFDDFEVLVDYAHNPHGYAAVEQYLSTVTASKKIGIISGIGDRRDEDIRECALIACRMFDHVIIRQEHDLRGRTEDGINSLLVQGIMASCKKVDYEIIREETDAIRRALSIAKKGDLVVALSDQYKDVIAVINQELDKRALSQKVMAIPSAQTHHQLHTINQNNNYHGRSA